MNINDSDLGGDSLMDFSLSRSFLGNLRDFTTLHFILHIHFEIIINKFVCLISYM